MKKKCSNPMSNRALTFAAVLFMCLNGCNGNDSGPPDSDADLETIPDPAAEDMFGDPPPDEISDAPAEVPDSADPVPDDMITGDEPAPEDGSDLPEEADGPETPPCLPDPGDPDVFDMEGVERDLAWLAAEYGSQFQRADMERICVPGGVYRLTEFREREGPSNIDVTVFDEGGSPIASLPVAFYWPDAPETSREDEWYPVKFTGITNDEGRVGFALGGGSYHGPGEGGPHAIWVSDETYPGDLADRLGMLVGTNHRHLDLTFVLMLARE
ncbi:MAG: hypothetical protein ABIJ56_21455 [Pseudomonadota bacterium]